MMIEVIKDTFVDSLKLFPFLLVAYLIMEYLEHKFKGKTENIISSSGKCGPILGSVFGSFPQCGFALLGSNLYVTRIITLGTLMSIYLSTSDEMLPILIANKMEGTLILKIIIIKIIIGMTFGFIIDFIFRKKEKSDIKHFCEEEHCDCEKSIVLSAFKHALKVYFFILILTFIFNLIFEFIDRESIKNIFITIPYISPIIGAFIGLIPSCAASVIITELYVTNIISFGTLIAGLCSSAGAAVVVLFKINKNLKENFKILGLLLIISCMSGFIIDVVSKI